MPKFRILTPAGLSFSNSGGGYSFEMEALEGMDAEIFECPTTEDGFIAACKGVDAVYGKGMKFTRKMINALDRCKVISLGTVGVDYVEVGRPPRRASPSPIAPTPSLRRWLITP